MTTANTPPGLWTGQPLHFTCLALLLILVYLAWGLLNQPTPLAFWAAVAFPVAHQIYVWLAWRLTLQTATISRVISFQGYLIIFFTLFGGRFIALFTLAWLDRGSLNLDTTLVSILTPLLTLPGLYAMYSVRRYFGMRRAAGADHFDAHYRNLPLVKEGIFRFTSNGMYLYAFLLFWAIAIGFNSSATLLVAAFSHIYIWVHFYATEKPDMDFLYAQPASKSSVRTAG